MKKIKLIDGLGILEQQGYIVMWDDRTNLRDFMHYYKNCYKERLAELSAVSNDSLQWLAWDMEQIFSDEPNTLQ